MKILIDNFEFELDEKIKTDEILLASGNGNGYRITVTMESVCWANNGKAYGVTLSYNGSYITVKDCRSIQEALNMAMCAVKFDQEQKKIEL
jgi:hypothetical protein